jgi:hypothetical protein
VVESQTGRPGKVELTIKSVMAAVVARNPVTQVAAPDGCTDERQGGGG